MGMWAVLLGAFGCADPGPEIPTVEATSGDLVVTVLVEGELEAVNSTTLRTPEIDGGTTLTFLAEHGSVVEEGELVVEFASDDLQTKKKDAERNLLLSRVKLEQATSRAELRVKELNTAITVAGLDAEVAQMYRTDSQAVPRIEREEARVAELQAQIAIANSRDELATVRLDSRSEQQLLEIEIRQTEKKLTDIEEQLGKTRLLAPTAGLALVQRNRRTGERWQAGSEPWRSAELVEIPDMSRMKAVVRVHEIDSPGILEGQPATVVMLSHPDDPVDGVVSKVADLAVAQRGSEVKYLDVEVELDEMWMTMRPGMTVDVSIELRRLDDVVMVPLDAVWGDEEPYVWSEGLTGWEQVPVEMGAYSDTHVVVDLDGGTVVALVEP